MSIAKPIVVITGASSGIGVAFAEIFARNGHEIVLVARREQQLAALADRLAAAGSPRPHLIPLDLARPDAGADLARALSERGLEPGIIVNNAGFGLAGPAARLDRAEQLTMIDLHTRTVADLSLRFVDSLARHRGGIINVASVASFVPGPNMAVYHATKAFILSFTESIHQELKAKGVRVTAVCPGPVATEFQARAGTGVNHFPARFARSAERVARDGYAAFMQGRRLVVPGFDNRVATLVPNFLPRSIVLRIVTAMRRQKA